MASSSGTYAFNPSISDVCIEAFERVGIKSAAITPEHMYSARMSANLLLADWTAYGVNLWKVDQQTVPLVQGESTYSVPGNTVMVLDAFLRLYAMSSPVNIAVSFSTTMSSPSVTINWSNNGLSVGEYINVIIPVSIGGLVIYGFYQVTAVLTANSFTITAASNATSGASGGAVPAFTAISASASISVALNNHGFVAGATFTVQVTTVVGNVTLGGNYTIATIVDANHFTITAPYPATANQTVSENGGKAQIAPQVSGATGPYAYTDRVISPISRTDYSALPNKQSQGYPTVFWYDRLINPTLTLWLVPDGSGPYELHYYRVTQIQDANPQMGQTADLPYRFMEAWASGMAYHLSRKWNPLIEEVRKQDAIEAMTRACAEDRERVSLNMSPQLDGYFS